VLAGSFSWPLLLVLINLPALPRLLRVFRQAKPDSPPADYPHEVWPLWFSAHAFSHTRRFTSLFLVAVVLDTLLT
jgi:1,4-dihydroxy-2-naphthoate octaprenyltransferase